MTTLPAAVADFLASRTVAVVGVSRQGDAPANAILRRLRETGHRVVPVNPHAATLEGETCYPDLRSIPGTVDAVMVVTPPAAGATVARAALERGIRRLWFHRSFGAGSVAADALQVCRDAGVEPIEGGCPLMYCGRVDPAHRAFRWWLGLRGRVPA